MAQEVLRDMANLVRQRRDTEQSPPGSPHATPPPRNAQTPTCEPSKEAPHSDDKPISLVKNSDKTEDLDLHGRNSTNETEDKKVCDDEKEVVAEAKDLLKVNGEARGEIADSGTTNPQSPPITLQGYLRNLVSKHMGESGSAAPEDEKTSHTNRRKGKPHKVCATPPRNPEEDEDSMLSDTSSNDATETAEEVKVGNLTSVMGQFTNAEAASQEQMAESISKLAERISQAKDLAAEKMETDMKNGDHSGSRLNSPSGGDDGESGTEKATSTEDLEVWSGIPDCVSLNQRQVLLLNGREYDIVPLGHGLWISRNEYELLKEMQAVQKQFHDTTKRIQKRRDLLESIQSTGMQINNVAALRNGLSSSSQSQASDTPTPKSAFPGPLELKHEQVTKLLASKIAGKAGPMEGTPSEIVFPEAIAKRKHEELGAENSLKRVKSESDEKSSSLSSSSHNGSSPKSVNNTEKETSLSSSSSGKDVVRVSSSRQSSSGSPLVEGPGAAETGSASSTSSSSRKAAASSSPNVPPGGTLTFPILKKLLKVPKL